MKNFRLFDLRIDNKNYKTKKIRLVNENKLTNDNYFSLIIGNNGTGKSRFLSTICKHFIGQKSLIKNINYSCNPQKVIALTHSISDKFPLDTSFRKKYTDKETLYSEMDYVYLGTKNQMHSSSSKVLMYRAIDIVFENYTDDHTATGYRHIFDYLGYEPIIKINYRITNLMRNDLFTNSILNVEKLRNFLEEKISKGNIGFRYKSIKDIMNNNMQLEEICNFYNSQDKFFNNNYNLIINFSENNISRLDSDDSIYQDKFKIYKILKLMKKINLVREVEINVYKKNGTEFSFSDASSGEANILSTLMALMPLIKDNTLLLIDEPEISLHPSWQYRYIDLLKKLLTHVNGCHIIIATHSHFLVSDLPIESSSVIAFKNNKNIIESELIESSTFGWSAEDILLNIFQLPTSRNYYLSQLVTEALELLAQHNKKTLRLQEIKTELDKIIPLLKDYDPLKKVIELIIEKV